MESHAEASGEGRKPGRPRSFDREAALEKAMLLFWAHGYETTSIADLTTAMGVTAPSLYAAFGDKERLFLEAARRYTGDLRAVQRRIESAATAFDAARTMLADAVRAYTGAATPRGCLLASATASGSVAASQVQRRIASVRRTIRKFLRTRIERDMASGAMSSRVDASALSSFVVTLTQGLSVMARDGMSRRDLMTVVSTALLAWPGEAS